MWSECEPSYTENVSIEENITTPRSNNLYRITHAWHTQRLNSLFGGRREKVCKPATRATNLSVVKDGEKPKRMQKQPQVNSPLNSETKEHTQGTRQMWIAQTRMEQVGQNLC